MRRYYVERGQVVEVLSRWRREPYQRGNARRRLDLGIVPGNAAAAAAMLGGTKQNVLVRRDDGELVVRPFRGLRRAPDEEQLQLAGTADL